MTIHKALITGGTGFVGSNLARRLVLDGWQVTIITVPNDKLDQIEDIINQVTLYVHDGSTDGMYTIVAKTEPDVVFHLASLFLSEHTSAEINRLIESNVLFGTQLLEAMSAVGASNIVNTGTSWQHYQNKKYSPVNLYAATKQAFEDILQYYVEARNIKAISLKLFDTYGPNDPRPKLFHLLEKIAREGSVLDMSPGDQQLDLVHVDDVVEAFVVAAERLIAAVVEGYEEYAVTSESPRSLRSVVQTVEAALGKKINIQWGGRPYRAREVMMLWNSGALLPGWAPKITLEFGVAYMRVIMCDEELHESKN